jgi:predicted metal-dependent HD superfamily phosphohydrolase
MISLPEVLTQVRRYATAVLAGDLAPGYTFHGLKHTSFVVSSCHELGIACQCNANDLASLLIAAWLHDVGYVGGRDNHEERGANMAMDFLSGFDCPFNIQGKVQKLILATRMPTFPRNILEEILCDADLSHLGAVAYPTWELNLRQELENIDGLVYSDELWREKNINFFKHHTYYTEKARRLWDHQKQRNLEHMTVMRTESP